MLSSSSASQQWRQWPLLLAVTALSLLVTAMPVVLPRLSQGAGKEQAVSKTSVWVKAPPRMAKERRPSYSLIPDDPGAGADSWPVSKIALPISVPVPWYRCDDLWNSFRKHGVSAIIQTALEMANNTITPITHKLGDFLGHAALQEGWNYTRMFLEDAIPNSWNGNLLDINGFGVLHGAIQTIIGLHPQHYDYKLMWRILLEQMCPPVIFDEAPYGPTSRDFWRFECLHGFGHAGMVKREPRWEPCDHFSSITHTHDVRAVCEICMAAPTISLSFLCATGCWHGVVEHWDLTGHNTPSLTYPCDVTDLYPNDCYHWFFMYLGYAPWRRHIVQNLPDLRSVCTAAKVESESNLLACIFGIADVYFPSIRIYLTEGCEHSTINKLWYPLLWIHDDGSQADHFHFQDNHCALMNRTAKNLGWKKKPNLVEFCSEFIWPTPTFDAYTLEKRWLACIAGALNFFNWVTNFPFPPPNEYDDEEFCEPLLHVSWQSMAQRNKSYAVCQESNNFAGYPHGSNGALMVELGWAPKEDIGKPYV